YVASLVHAGAGVDRYAKRAVARDAADGNGAGSPRAVIEAERTIGRARAVEMHAGRRQRARLEIGIRVRHRVGHRAGIRARRGGSADGYGGRDVVEGVALTTERGGGQRIAIQVRDARVVGQVELECAVAVGQAADRDGPVEIVARGRRTDGADSSGAG